MVVIDLLQRLPQLPICRAKSEKWVLGLQSVKERAVQKGRRG